MTTKTYFTNCTTLEELKKEYRKLAMANNPDRGGDAEIFKAVVNEYHKLFETLKDVHKTKEGKTYRKATNEKPNDFIDLINVLLKMDGIHIEVIGCFVWVSGNTKPHKDGLKALKFRWHTEKKCWYKAPDDYVRRGKTKYTMSEIRDMYGVQYEGNGKEDTSKMLTC